LTITLDTLSGTSGLTTITNSGSGGITLTADTNSATAIAFANTGTGTLTETALVANSAATQTITGTGAVKVTETSTKAGDITVTQTGNSNVTFAIGHTDGTTTHLDTIVLGNGNDSVTITGLAANTLALTTGTGTNTVVLKAGHAGVDNITLAANGASQTALDTISNMTFASAADTLTFASAFAVTTVITTTANTDASLSAFVLRAQAAYVAGTGVQLMEETIGANTYVYQATGTAATDTLVTIVGAHTFTAATGVTHLATLAT